MSDPASRHKLAGGKDCEQLPPVFQVQGGLPGLDSAISHPLPVQNEKKVVRTSSKFENGQSDYSSETSGHPQERPRGHGGRQPRPEPSDIPLRRPPSIGST